jgi:hypothetical protein
MMKAPQQGRRHSSILWASVFQFSIVHRSLAPILLLLLRQKVTAITLDGALIPCAMGTCQDGQHTWGRSRDIDPVVYHGQFVGDAPLLAVNPCCHVVLQGA